jgi:hypothetical protein
MRVRMIYAIFVLGLILAGARADLACAEQAQARREAENVDKQTVRVMAKGPDSIVVGEEHLYVVPKVTRITDSAGALMDLGSLRTPCQAEVSYTRWMKGIKKAPVALHVHVLKEYPGASAVSPHE